MKKITHEEAKEYFKSCGYDLIDEYKDAKSKLTAITKEGYKIYVSLDTLKNNVAKNSSPSLFGRGNIYTIHNIKNIWIPINAPEYELLDDEYVNNSKKMEWRLKNGKLRDFNMSWSDFQIGQRHPDLKFERMKEKQKLRNPIEKINALLYKYNPEWNLISEYNNYQTPLLFKSSDGFLMKRTYINLKRSNSKMPIYNGYYPEESTHNMYKYISGHCKDIELLSDQTFKTFHDEYEFNCSTHGIFKSIWGNFFYREQGCPLCMQIQRSKGEEKIIEWFESRNIDYKHQQSFDDLIGVGGKKLRYDFSVKTFNEEIVALIEFHGDQHFRPVEWFGGNESFERLTQNDKLKTQYAKDNNIPLIVIMYREQNRIGEILTEKLNVCVKQSPIPVIV